MGQRYYRPWPMLARKGLAAALVLSSVTAWPFQAGSAPDQASADWRKALGLYKRKKLDLACPLFESAARAKRDNGAIWADLGLCELKRGRIPESVHASQLAVRFGSEPIRKSAYFNLDLASSRLPVSEACQPLPSAPELECDKPTYACTRDFRLYGSGMGTDGSVGFFSDTQQHAEQMAGVYAERASDDPIDGLLLSKRQVCFGWCARHPEVQCDDSDCHEGEVLTCAVVSVDACRRRVGVVCDEWDEPDAQKRTYALEFELPEP